MGKALRPTSHQDAIAIHFTTKICWGGAGLGSVGGSECLRSHWSSSQQEERKHRAERISPNPCWFFFFCGLKRSQIRAKCPSQLPNEHYAISPWLSGFLGLFVSLKGFLFRDGHPNDTGATIMRLRSPQPCRWVLSMKILSFFKVRSP